MFTYLANVFKPRPLVFTRHRSSCIVRSPPKTAPRESPTPLVFVSAKNWDVESDKGMTVISSLLSEKGFTCLQNDLALPDPQTRADSSAMLKWFESELRSTIRLSTIPFPPVIFARASGCLIGQTYVSSNPATGLVLISPPRNNAELQGIMGHDKLPILQSQLSEFNFEPHFPIAVIAKPGQMKTLEEFNRLVRAPEVDKITVDDLEGQRALDGIHNWLDQLGV
ncbi:hypothetical protein AGABI1DRAFT_66672, partial [Agaricus bisporus var. burnettii JB137-S8]